MDLFTKAKELGIQTEFTDAQGRRRVTDEAALRTIIDALPPPADHCFLNQGVVMRSGHPGRTRLKRLPTLPLSWKIVAQDRVVAKGEARVGQADSGDHVILWPPDLPEGSYRLHLMDAASLTDEAPMIVAPEKAYGGDFDRCWLLAVQLYGIRSGHNWGIGDFSDLHRLIELAAQFGADGVGLNPLHVLCDDRPADCSPYSPNSRLFLNPLYIDVERVPGFQPGEESQALAGLKQSDIVDYVGVAGLKWRALRSAFARFKAHPQNEQRHDFEKFRREAAPVLSRFACFEVLRHKSKRPWWEWPEEWRQPDDTKCAKLREGEDEAEI